ncbi:YqaH family protein [Bacillus sp. z60-18]|uniref:YqaH family protein n=1 Tax=unclassified Bacillus (in: firmicutes) TaxID=185979 RepID=UPI00390CB5C0
MNLDKFLKVDREKAEALIKATHILVVESMQDAWADKDYTTCVKHAALIISHCQDLKRMETCKSLQQTLDALSEKGKSRLGRGDLNQIK